MRYLCNLSINITVEAATLIGLILIFTTSYLYTTIMMARRRRSGAAKAADGKGAAPGRRDNDNRPENS
jgi:cbb3-type cytochrome oxidase subunit 3